MEKAGVLDSLMSVLVTLYEEPEKPDNALEFVKQHLAAVVSPPPETEALQQEVMELREKYARLMQENKELKNRLQHYEAVSEDEGGAN